MPPKKSSNRRTGDNIGYYVVCLLDVLGQSEKLKEWSCLPPDGTLPPQAEEAIRQTVDTVRNLRRQFRNFFAQFEKCTISDEDWKRATLAEKVAYKRYKACTLEIMTFSDTLVFYAAMRNDSGDISPLPLNRMLKACATMMIVKLAERIPLRGAVTIGTGLEMGDKDFYGPALAEAHWLESKCAGYPRVLVSKKVVDFTQVQGGFSQDPRVDVNQAKMNRQSAELVCKDKDEQYIVDFLGKAMSSFVMATSSANQVKERVIALHQFASEELDRFKRLADKKHEERYSRLLQYIESRLPNWGIWLEQG